MLYLVLSAAVAEIDQEDGLPRPYSVVEGSIETAEAATWLDSTKSSARATPGWDCGRHRAQKGNRCPSNYQHAYSVLVGSKKTIDAAAWLDSTKKSFA